MYNFRPCPQDKTGREGGWVTLSCVWIYCGERVHTPVGPVRHHVRLLGPARTDPLYTQPPSDPYPAHRDGTCRMVDHHLHLPPQVCSSTDDVVPETCDVVPTGLTNYPRPTGVRDDTGSDQEFEIVRHLRSPLKRFCRTNEVGSHRLSH